jgi:hypothetical protein
MSGDGSTNEFWGGDDGRWAMVTWIWSGTARYSDWGSMQRGRHSAAKDGWIQSSSSSRCCEPVMEDTLLIHGAGMQWYWPPWGRVRRHIAQIQWWDSMLVMFRLWWSMWRLVRVDLGGESSSLGCGGISPCHFN